MKKSLLLSVLSLLVCISCSNDDDNYELKLSGKWECKSASTTIIDLRTSEEVQGFYGTVLQNGSRLYFYDNGRMRYEYLGVTSDSHYKLSGNNIEFHLEATYCYYKIGEVTSSRLSLYRDTVIQKDNIKLINKAQFEKID